ncbi:MAG TPA: hypothetical protein VIT68_00155, partial [Candidatus Gracilibacteria bacterium]
TQSGQSVDSEDRDQNAEVEALLGGINNQLILEHLGLHLEKVTRNNVSAFTEEGQTDLYQLKFKLRNPSELLGFLQKLDRDDVASNPALADQIAAIMTDFETYLLEYAQVADPDDEELNLYVHLGTIMPELDRIGIATPQTAELVTAAEHIGHRTFGEYLSAQKQNLLPSQRGEFGPAIWVIDITPALLAQKWDDALNFLENLSKRPEGGDFARTLKTHLLACIEQARGILAGTVGDYPFPEEYRARFESFRETLSQAKQRLERLEIVG